MAKAELEGEHKVHNSKTETHEQKMALREISTAGVINKLGRSDYALILCVLAGIGTF